MIEHSVALFFKSLADLVVDSAFWLLGGFLLAGLIHEFIPAKTIARHLSGKGFGPVAKAALIGTPLPLCSCGVIPTAVGLRKDGASKPATVSFLISTPETGVDSIAVSYALLDPFLTILRPVAAVLTSLAAGTVELLFGQKENRLPLSVTTLPGATTLRLSWLKRFAQAIRYGFGDLLADIALYLVFGFLLSAALSALLPANWITRTLGRSDFTAMLLMAGVSTPLYICSTSATPLASVLLLKGLSPGAALVFLLVGPATNTTTMVAVAKFLGKRSLVLYLLSIVVTSLLLGLAVNAFYRGMGTPSMEKVAAGADIIPNGVAQFSGLVLAAILLGHTGRATVKRFRSQRASGPSRRER